MYNIVPFQVVISDNTVPRMPIDAVCIKKEDGGEVVINNSKDRLSFTSSNIDDLGNFLVVFLNKKLVGNVTSVILDGTTYDFVPEKIKGQFEPRVDYMITDGDDVRYINANLSLDKQVEQLNDLTVEDLLKATKVTYHRHCKNPVINAILNYNDIDPEKATLHKLTTAINKYLTSSSDPKDIEQFAGTMWHFRVGRLHPIQKISGTGNYAIKIAPWSVMSHFVDKEA